MGTPSFKLPPWVSILPLDLPILILGLLVIFIILGNLIFDPGILFCKTLSNNIDPLSCNNNPLLVYIVGLYLIYGVLHASLIYALSLLYLLIY